MDRDDAAQAELGVVDQLPGGERVLVIVIVWRCGFVDGVEPVVVGPIIALVGHVVGLGVVFRQLVEEPAGDSGVDLPKEGAVVGRSRRRVQNPELLMTTPSSGPPRLPISIGEAWI